MPPAVYGRRTFTRGTRTKEKATQAEVRQVTSDREGPGRSDYFHPAEFPLRYYQIRLDAPAESRCPPVGARHVHRKMRWTWHPTPVKLFVTFFSAFAAEYGLFARPSA